MIIAGISAARAVTVESHGYTFFFDSNQRVKPYALPPQTTAAAPRTVVKTEILRIKNEIKSKKLLVTNLAATVTQKDFQGI
jgi:hypothetical protein